MEKYYKEKLASIIPWIKGAIVLKVEHNEDADEGMIIHFSNGVSLVLCWSGEEGSAEIMIEHKK